VKKWWHDATLGIDGDDVCAACLLRDTNVWAALIPDEQTK
jgi:hypothetical protein